MVEHKLQHLHFPAALKAWEFLLFIAELWILIKY